VDNAHTPLSAPWTAEVTPNCFIVRDADGQQLAYVYYESEPGRRSAAKLLSKDEARRIVGVPITIVGALGYIAAGWPHEALLPPLSLGFVSLIGLVVMAPLSSLTAPYGARLAHKLSRRTLEIAFAIFLLVVSLRFVVSLF
jgi:Sulfite exporter TauE/SafE